ncbi:MAG: hypothetical protein ACLUSP_07090 [Christensenellales bacterium]
MTTYVGEKGWYVATEVTDSALVYNGLLAPRATARFIFTTFSQAKTPTSPSAKFIWTRAEFTAERPVTSGLWSTA